MWLLLKINFEKMNIIEFFLIKYVFVFILRVKGN